MLSHLFLFVSFPWNPLEQCGELLLYFHVLLQRLLRPRNLLSTFISSFSSLLLLTSNTFISSNVPPGCFPSCPASPSHSSPSDFPQLRVWSTPPYLHLKGELVGVHLQPRRVIVIHCQNVTIMSSQVTVANMGLVSWVSSEVNYVIFFYDIGWNINLSGSFFVNTYWQGNGWGVPIKLNQIYTKYP